MAAAIGQTISVIDKSGKVVSTSKHLFSVFKEARSAYKERKAVIRSAEEAKRAERDTRRALAAYTLEDDRSTTSKRHLGRAKSVVRHHDDDRQSRHHSHHSSRSQKRRSFEFEVRSEYPDGYHPNSQLARRHTEHNLSMAKPVRPSYGEARAHTLPKVDMDLAYGEFHQSALDRLDPEPSDMPGLVGRVKDLLVEADCAHHSVTATIAHLQSNPDAMAAVALTLAEISKLVSDLGPTALATLRASAPAVFALLASPHFMIAAGVGIGVTVVMFGGYKIIKQISSKPEGMEERQLEAPVMVDELLEINSGMSRIEGWRRGVAESEAESCGTSVDGEFITPTAAAMSRVMLNEQHAYDNDRRSEVRSSRILPAPTRVSSYVGGSVYETGSQYSRRSHSSRHSKSSKTSRSHSESKHKKDELKEKERKKKKKPSPLRKLFS
ncbi:conserved hypothetical protein [Trichophyton verrucosum HKI 0517]|uniref:Uncharacterized protein n=1 Tax=Trichophyton verrucosum (strain HKI 0517) TaxID=663202 RepID=D4DI79_TRIVH|nr:uncharacterized protein TRV_06887 [Trichophyton verrucosum HKI 0517]EFE38417.1 conserved hypothetical protein [Trichophyton verrucosum HKI 0517]